MDTTALAGGAIGSLVTLAAGLVVRSLSVPQEVRAHDRLAAERDCDLEQWVADESLALKRRLRVERAELAGRHALSSGDYAFQLGVVKEQALHAYRDQERQAKRDVARIFDREGWLHSAWRAITRQQPYKLQAPAAALPALDVWRLPLKTLSTNPDEPPREIDDPTQRTLAKTIAGLRVDPAAFQ